MKILIIAEYVGKEGFEENDRKVVQRVRECHEGNEVHLFCQNCFMNEAGDYIRMKGIMIHPIESQAIGFPTEYDEIIKIDEWATQNSAQFTSLKQEVAQTPTKEVKSQHESKNEGKNGILIACDTMTYLSGSPLYHYTLAIELAKKGKTVKMYSQWKKNEMMDRLEEAGVEILRDQPVGHFDLAILSQESSSKLLETITADKILNVIHSEYDCENPIISDMITEYIAIRPSIKEHLIEDHGIPEEKIRIVYNGVDFERFNPQKRKRSKKKFTKVVIPCTIDPLRREFLEYYIEKANKDFRVFIYGKDFGADIPLKKYVTISDEVFDIENKMADADIVAGILLGRVNLEARAMGIHSYIHDPKNPAEYEDYFPVYREFKRDHDIVNVAKQLI